MFTPFAFVKSAAPAAPSFEFLLDTQSAFVAYSTSRKLSSTYTGSAFRARKNSDGSQQDIGFVNNLVDTASLATFLAGTDGGIVTWYDQSGNGKNLGGNGGNLPQIKSGGNLITQAGYQAVTTNGASEYFAQTTAFSSNKVVEIMCVGSLTSRTLANSLWWCNPDNGYSFGSYETSTNAVSTVKSDGGRLGQQTVTLGQAYLIDQFDNVDGGTNASFLNISGTQTNYTLVTGDWVATSFNKINLGRGPFGGTFYENTKMNEWIMFGDATSNRTALRNNINTFYGL
jgi:hypothetical protein